MTLTCYLICLVGSELGESRVCVGKLFRISSSNMSSSSDENSVSLRSVIIIVPTNLFGSLSGMSMSNHCRSFSFSFLMKMNFSRKSTPLIVSYQHIPSHVLAIWVSTVMLLLNLGKINWLRAIAFSDVVLHKCLKVEMQKIRNALVCVGKHGAVNQSLGGPRIKQEFEGFYWGPCANVFTSSIWAW